MNHQIIAAIALGNSMRLLQGRPPEECAELAMVSLMQMDPSLTQGEAARFVLTALAEIANIPFTAAQVQEEFARQGYTLPVH